MYITEKYRLVHPFPFLNRLELFLLPDILFESNGEAFEYHFQMLFIQVALENVMRMNNLGISVIYIWSLR